MSRGGSPAGGKGARGRDDEERASFASPVVDLALRRKQGAAVDLASTLSPPAFFWLPRLNSTERAALLNYGGGLQEYRCASDTDCAGLPWDPVVGGVCGADGRCGALGGQRGTPRHSSR